MPRTKKKYMMYAINEKNEICRVIATKHGRTEMDVIFDGHSEPVTVKTSELYDSIPSIQKSVIKAIRDRSKALAKLQKKEREELQKEHFKALSVFSAQERLIVQQCEELRKNIPVLC